MNRLQATLILLCLLPVTTAGLSSTILATDPAPVEPGEYADITVRLEASPGEQTYDRVTLQPIQTDLITPISQPKQYSSIQEGDTITATFTVYIEDNAPEGDLPFLVELASERSNQTFDERIRVTDTLDTPELRVGAAKTTPNEIIQDTDDNTVSLTLNNLGDENAEQVTTNLAETEYLKQSYAYSLEDTASSVEANSQTTFTYTFDVEEGRQEPIETELAVSYREEDDDIVETTLPVTIPVANAPYLKVTNVTTDALTQGSVGNPVRVTVQNQGSADAEELRVRLFPDISYPFLFDTTTRYVASTLEPGDEATVEYTVEVLSDAKPRDYQITTEMESLVNTNRYERQDTVTIPVGSNEAQSYGWLPYAIVAAILFVATAIGLYQYRSRGNA